MSESCSFIPKSFPLFPYFCNTKRLIFTHFYNFYGTYVCTLHITLFPIALCKKCTISVRYCCIKNVYIKLHEYVHVHNMYVRKYTTHLPLSRQQHMYTTTMEIITEVTPATPPTTPPAMAPALLPEPESPPPST